ncbi:uncharacterized protein BT62DRAFT_926169, partial [Guyanagaster necrorhizus]
VKGFFGGSLLGREFWRNVRGGGDSGARAFRSHCMKHLVSQTSIAQGYSSSTDLEILYEKIRNALRTTSAGRLATYGVTLVGWPSTIPMVNPSNLKAGQSRELTLLENGTMKLVWIYISREQDGVQPSTSSTEDDPDSFSWALQFDDTLSEMSGRSRSPVVSGPRKRPKLLEHAMEPDSS